MTLRSMKEDRVVQDLVTRHFRSAPKSRRQNSNPEASVGTVVSGGDAFESSSRALGAAGAPLPHCMSGSWGRDSSRHWWLPATFHFALHTAAPQSHLKKRMWTFGRRTRLGWAVPTSLFLSQHLPQRRDQVPKVVWFSECPLAARGCAAMFDRIERGCEKHTYFGLQPANLIADLRP